MNCLNTKTFEMNGKKYFIRLAIENGELVVNEIIKEMSSGPTGLGKAIYKRK